MKELVANKRGQLLLFVAFLLVGVLIEAILVFAFHWTTRHAAWVVPEYTLAVFVVGLFVRCFWLLLRGRKP